LFGKLKKNLWREVKKR